MRNIYLEILANETELNDLVLATVTGTEGSSPQKPGSSALFKKGHLVSGTVGGGVLEGKVQAAALEILNTRVPYIMKLRLNLELKDGEDALCGGTVNVLIDPDLSKHLNTFRSLGRSLMMRTPGILATLVKINSVGNATVERYWAVRNEDYMAPGELSPYIEKELAELKPGSDFYDFREIRIPSEQIEQSSLLFLEPVVPQSRLIIAGAGHIGRALSRICSILGFDITVIDDRHEYANPGNIPFANNFIVDDIGESIKKLEKTSDTFIVIVTRGHRDDSSALRACIGSGAKYIGMIGSKNKVELMKREFIANNWATLEEWNSVWAPIGLDIKSKSVEEIAISIAAQLIQVKNSNR